MREVCINSVVNVSIVCYRPKKSRQVSKVACMSIHFAILISRHSLNTRPHKSVRYVMETRPNRRYLGKHYFRLIFVDLKKTQRNKQSKILLNVFEISSDSTGI